MSATDVGNRITELSKVVGRVHTEMKELHKTIISGLESQGTTKTDSSDVLSRYILGAKNNFRGFDNKMAWQGSSAPLEVAVHIEDEEKEEKRDEETTQEKKDEKTTEEVKAEESKEEDKGEGSKEEKKQDMTKLEKKEEVTMQGNKYENTKQEHKIEIPKQENKVDTTKLEHKVDVTKQEQKVEGTTNEKTDEGKERQKERKRENGVITSTGDTKQKSAPAGSVNGNSASQCAPGSSTERKTENRRANGTSETKISTK